MLTRSQNSNKRRRLEEGGVESATTNASLRQQSVVGQIVTLKHTTRTTTTQRPSTKKRKRITLKPKSFLKFAPSKLSPIPLQYQAVPAINHWQIQFHTGVHEWHASGRGLSEAEPLDLKGENVWMDVPPAYQAWFEVSVDKTKKVQEKCSFYLGKVRFDVIDHTFGVYCLHSTNPSHFQIRSVIE